LMMRSPGVQGPGGDVPIGAAETGATVVTVAEAVRVGDVAVPEAAAVAGPETIGMTTGGVAARGTVVVGEGAAAGRSGTLVAAAREAWEWTGAFFERCTTFASTSARARTPTRVNATAGWRSRLSSHQLRDAPVAGAMSDVSVTGAGGTSGAPLALATSGALTTTATGAVTSS